METHNKPSKKVLLECQCCGKQWEGYKSTRPHENKFCGPHCRLHWIQRSMGRASYPVQCSWCGKDLEIRGAKIREHNFCGLSERTSGEDKGCFWNWMRNGKCDQQGVDNSTENNLLMLPQFEKAQIDAPAAQQQPISGAGVSLVAPQEIVS